MKDYLILGGIIWTLGFWVWPKLVELQNEITEEANATLLKWCENELPTNIRINSNEITKYDFIK